MKTLMRLGYAAAAFGVAFPAVAANTNVKTQVGSTCTFTTPNIVATIAPVLGETNVGNHGFACNFVGTALVTLSVPGGTFLKSGANKVRYELKWDAESPTPNYQYSPNPVVSFQVQFDADTNPTANVALVKPVWVKLDQVPTVAGTYTSVATYTVSP